jgi:hypothetical protein
LPRQNTAYIKEWLSAAPMRQNPLYRETLQMPLIARRLIGREASLLSRSHQ